MKKKLFLLYCFLLPFIYANAQQPVCNGILGEPILNLTFGQGNANLSAYSPLSTYAPGLSTNTMFQNSGGLVAANTTALVKNSSVFGPSGYWIQSNDHTGNPYGLLLGINMPGNVGDTVVEYLMTGLCPNTTLQYSIWLLNLMDPNHPLVTGGSPYIQYPNMVMRIVDLSNNVLGTLTTGNVPHDGVWHQYAFLFSNGNNSTVKLQLINNTSGSDYGNDVALDDITVRPCVPIAHIFPKLDTTLCQSTSMNFTANITVGAYSASSYQWQYSTNQGATWINGGSPSANNSYNFSFSTANATTEYWIRYLVSPDGVASNINCHATSDTSIIRIDTVAHNFLNPSDTIFCSGNSVYLPFNNVNANGYLWNTGATSASINTAASGTYWLQLTSLYGCKSSDTIHITIPKAKILPPVDTTLCASATIHFDGNLTPVIYNPPYYQWQYSTNQGNSWINTGSISSNSVSDIAFNTANVPAEYWIRFLASASANTINQSCFTISDTSVVRIDSMPQKLLPNDTTMCNYGNLFLEVTTPNAVSYQWNTGAITSTISITTPGNYWVKATSLFGCQSADSIQVNITQTAQPNLGNDTSFCEGSSYVLDVSNLEADHYLWSNGSTNSSIEVSSGGIYSVNAFFNGCITSDSVTVNFTEIPQVNLIADTTICEGSQVVLKSTTDYPDAQYIWNNGSTNHTITVNVAGEYSLTVKRYPNCSASDSVTIATSKCDCDLMVPNAFSPNGDGRNDDYKPRLISAGCPLKNYRLYIYNRWGQLVYNTINVDHGWDGTFNGKYADAGTYMYYISFTDWATQKEKSYKGNLTLIR